MLFIRFFTIGVSRFPCFLFLLYDPLVFPKYPKHRGSYVPGLPTRPKEKRHILKLPTVVIFFSNFFLVSLPSVFYDLFTSQWFQFRRTKFVGKPLWVKGNRLRNVQFLGRISLNQRSRLVLPRDTSRDLSIWRVTFNYWNVHLNVKSEVSNQSLLVRGSRTNGDFSTFFLFFFFLKVGNLLTSSSVIDLVMISPSKMGGSLVLVFYYESVVPVIPTMSPFPNFWWLDSFRHLLTLRSCPQRRGSGTPSFRIYLGWGRQRFFQCYLLRYKEWVVKLRRPPSP